MAGTKALASAGDDDGLDPILNAALRELAGWPVHHANSGGRRHMTRERLIHYDSEGNITGATERIYEEEIQDYSHYWRK